jgi:uroporphyrin-III C-methyltransferase/precorrin-2 dehydrogenase/sirohydrochlorin ferrochelatase
VLRSTLGQVAVDVVAEAIRPPAVVVFGDVVTALAPA